MRRRISFCLYIKKEPTITREALIAKCTQEVSHINNHIQKFSEVALSLTHPIPEFYIHLLFVELGKKGFNYCTDLQLSEDINALFRANIVNRIRGVSLQIHICEFIVTRLEKNYFKDNFNGGDLIDLMKLRVLFEPYANDKPDEYVDHLQLDTNVIITDYRQMYALTFERREPQFFINVYSDTRRIFTVNNKVIFVPQQHSLFRILSDKYFDFMSQHNFASSSELSIYKRVFLATLKELSILDASGFIDFKNKDHFLITSVIAGRVLQTWSNARSRLSSSSDERDVQNFKLYIPSKNELVIDYYSFINYLRKHSTCLLGPDSNRLKKHHSLFRKYAVIDEEKNFMMMFIRAAICHNSSFIPVFAKMIEQLDNMGRMPDAHGYLAVILKNDLEDALQLPGPEKSISDSTDAEDELTTTALQQADVTKSDGASIPVMSKMAAIPTVRNIHPPRVGIRGLLFSADEMAREESVAVSVLEEQATSSIDSAEILNHVVTAAIPGVKKKSKAVVVPASTSTLDSTSRKNPPMSKKGRQLRFFSEDNKTTLESQLNSDFSNTGS